MPVHDSNTFITFICFIFIININKIKYKFIKASVIMDMFVYYNSSILIHIFLICLAVIIHIRVEHTYAFIVLMLIVFIQFYSRVYIHQNLTKTERIAKSIENKYFFEKMIFERKKFPKESYTHIDDIFFTEHLKYLLDTLEGKERYDFIKNIKQM